MVNNLFQKPKVPHTKPRKVRIHNTYKDEFISFDPSICCPDEAVEKRCDR
jgi:hypothetical protein